MRLTPSTRVYLLAVFLCAALTVCSRTLDDRGGPRFIASLAVAGITYLFAVREFFSAPALPRRVVIMGLVVAAVWHVQFLRMPPGPDDDVHRYVWDGRIQRLGYNPYLVVPSDPGARRLHTSETRNLNNPDVPSPYPAGAQLFFRAVTAIHESTSALKLAFVFCDFAIVFVVLHILRGENRGAHLVLVYAWNPLLAFEVAGSGHVDIVGALLLVISFAALLHRRGTIAAVTFGLAVAVKFLPLVLLPAYWKRVRLRDAVLAVSVIALLYLPFIDHSRIPIGSLLTYVQTWRFNDPVFARLEELVPQIAAGLPVIVGFVTATWLTRTDPQSFSDLFAWPMAASLLCAPAVYPWYLIWLLPFLRSASTLPFVIWTVSIIPTYVVWHLRTLGRPWSVPGWIVLLEYGSVATAGAVIAFLRAHKRSDPRNATLNPECRVSHPPHHR
ncbi:MAG: hypothetical protein JO108_12845 [Acidobacteriaceae bacterium]|nr:hypothetical protein [Acidobacteriaceae bacterium]